MSAPSINPDRLAKSLVNSSSVCIFDGYRVKTIPLPEGARRRVYQSPAGQLWTAGAAGLWLWNQGVWKRFAVPEIGDEVSLCPIRHNIVLCLLPDRLALFQAASPPSPLQTLRVAREGAIGKFLGLTVGAGDELWLTGESGLARLAGPKRGVSAATGWREILPPPALGLRHSQNPQPDENGVTFVADSDDGQVAVRCDGEQWETHPFPGQKILFTWRGPGKTWWSATSNALFQWHDGGWRADESLSARNYFDLAVDERGSFWLSTSEGLTRFTPPLWSPAEPDNETRRRLQASATNSLPPSISPPELGGAANFTCVLQTRTGDFWVGGSFGTAWRHDRWTIFPSVDQSGPHDVFHLEELSDGRIWAASREKIWSFDGRNWSAARNGFNHINALFCAQDGSVWVGSDSGVERFVQENWTENGTTEGLSSAAVLALGNDAHGNLWARTLKDFERYHPEADPDPPRVFIQPASQKEQEIPEDGVLTARFDGEDKWQVTTCARLLFSHRLDEAEWSPFEEGTQVRLSDLPVGKHYFQIRAMDRNGNVTKDPAHLEFAVVLPWYKEGRLVLIALSGAGAALFFAALAHRRHRDLVLSYAQVERQVAERTRELEAASQELVQSQKMRALGTLAASIAHDFNNILSIVKGSAQIIEDNLEDPAKIRTRADRIKTVVDQGSAVVQAMLGFSRDSDEILEAREINPIIDNTVKLLGDRFLREVELRCERAPELPRVRASQSLVQQILLNFIFNAAESMNGRKSVVITTARAGRLPPGMALQPAAAASYVTVAVRDFGCGISAENAPRVFEPFFTTKALSTQRGTGLGLSIVYELAKKMEAGLALESTVGQGSVFSLYLPANPEN